MDMREWKLLSVALFAMLAGTGCLSYSSVHTATPLEKGEVSVKGAGGYQSYEVPFSNDPSTDNFNVPATEFHGRVGLGNNMEIGGKLYFFGGGLDFNYAPINTADFALSLNPAVAYSTVTFGGGPDTSSVGWGTGVVNILADVVKTENVTFTVGAKPGAIHIRVDEDSITTPALGGTAGFEFRVGDRITIQPWFDSLYNFDTDTFFFNGLLGFGAKFDGMGGG
jgi:hypothetical protein